MSIQAGPGQLTGRCVLVPNPCTTRPCLPGMAFALEMNGAQVIICDRGHWFSDARFWGDYQPRPGDTVTVRGVVRTCVDIDGRPFQVIDAESVRSAAV